METRTVETTSFDADSFRLCGIRWAAVLAGLAVGLGVHMLLMLIGAAAGLAVYGAGVFPDGRTVPLAAALWSSISLLVTAAIGGYVAARTSGLRRTADGVMHAIAAWGASVLFYALLTGVVAGSTPAGAFGMAAVSTGITTTQSAETSMSELLVELERGDRDASVRLLRERFNLTPEQAERVADRGLSMFRTPGGSGSDANLSNAAQAASATSAWLSLIILLSLLAGAGGGMLGARGSLKRSRPGAGHYREHHVIHTPDHGIPTA